MKNEYQATYLTHFGITQKKTAIKMTNKTTQDKFVTDVKYCNHVKLPKLFPSFLISLLHFNNKSSQFFLIESSTGVTGTGELSTDVSVKAPTVVSSPNTKLPDLNFTGFTKFINKKIK